MSIDYSSLPEHMQQGMKDYVEFGYRPGSFLSLILSGNFISAAGAADDINQQAFFTYAAFLYTRVPGACCGSYRDFETWIEHEGMKGLYQYLDEQRAQSDLVKN